MVMRTTGNGTYEFKVKLSMKVRGVKISDEELYEETGMAVRMLADDLRTRYPWIGEVGLTGRSGGWLAIEDKKGAATEDELSDIDTEVDQARRDFEKAIIETFGYEENGSHRKNGSAFNADVDKWFDLVAETAKRRRYSAYSVGELVGIANLPPTPKHLELFMRTVPQHAPWAGPLVRMAKAIARGDYRSEFANQEGAIREFFSLFKQAAKYHGSVPELERRSHRPNIPSGEMTEDEKKHEFYRRQGLVGTVPRRMHTARTFDVVLENRGKEIGSKTELLKRGKVVQTSYHLPPLPEFLRNGAVDPKRRKAYDFFKEHAAYVVGRRGMGALELARAEQYAKDHDWEYEWEEDPEPYETDDPRDKPFEVLQVVLKDADGNVLASLGGIGMTGHASRDRDFRRLHEAELALEAMP